MAFFMLQITCKGEKTVAEFTPSTSAHETAYKQYHSCWTFFVTLNFYPTTRFMNNSFKKSTYAVTNFMW